MCFKDGQALMFSQTWSSAETRLDGDLRTVLVFCTSELEDEIEKNILRQLLN